MVSVNRQEIKFYLSRENSVSLQQQLGKLLSIDEHSKEGYYHVRSLYFDSIENMDLYDKLSGITKHKKIRIRVYNMDPNIIKLELKDKNGLYQKKLSVFLSREETNLMLESNYEFLLDRKDSYSNLFYIILTQGLYRPKTIIEYYRRAFEYPCFNTRITFDESIKSCNWCWDLFSKELPLLPVRTDGVVVELKFNGILVESIRRILEDYYPITSSVSKYAIARGAE